MNENIRGQACRMTGVLLATVIVLSAAVAQESGSPAVQAIDEPRIRIGSGMSTRSVPANAYVLVESVGQQWMIVEIGRKPLPVAKPESQELLVIADYFSLVEPDFSEYYYFKLKQKQQFRNKSDKRPVDTPPVDPYACISGEKVERPKYNPCDSKLTYASDIAKTVLGNAFMAVTTLGIAHASMGAFSAASVDREKVLAVLKETDAVETAKRYVRRHIYRNDFERAKTSGDYRAFINRYKDDDPDGLIPDAKVMIAEIEKAEKAKQQDLYRSQFAAAKTNAEIRTFIQRYESNDPDQLVPKAYENLKAIESEERRLATEAEDRARKMAVIEAERGRREAAALALWQSRLKIGDDTFCGPVIELRRPMVKIAVRAQLPGYASEAWLKAGEVFPAEAGCSNTNGRLRPAYR